MTPSIPDSDTLSTLCGEPARWVPSCASPTGRWQTAMGASGTPYQLTVQGGSWTATPRSVDDTGDFRITSGDGQRRVRVLEAMTRAWSGPPPSPRHVPHASGPLAPKAVSWVLPDFTSYPGRISSLTDPIYRHQSLPEQLVRTAQAALWMHKSRHDLQTDVLPSRLERSEDQIRKVLWPKCPPPVRAGLAVLASDPIGARLSMRDASSAFGLISLVDRPDPAETVTARLRYLILRVHELSGLTQKELANLVGTSQSWVSRLHRQVRPVLPRTLLTHLGRLGLGLHLKIPDVGTVDLGAPTRDIGDHTGWVYVAHNAAQGLVKVGRTIRSTGERLAEISRSADSPGRYKLVDARRTLRYRALEEALLEDLAPCAVEGEREFFHVEPSCAARRLREVAGRLDEKTFGRF